MSKKAKVILAVLAPIMVVLVVLFILVNAVYVPKPEPVVFPQGELTDSIFTEQNNTYTENDSLSVKHIFTSVPYTVDVTEGEEANVGSGTIYRVEGTEGFFIYTTEYDDTTNAQDIISSQFPAVMLINYIPEQTKIVVQNQKKGFINGFSAEYLAETLTASDGSKQTEAAILGYALTIPEVEYAGRHLFVGIGTTTITTESLDACSQVLSQVINTVTKDEKLEEERKREAEQAQKKQIEEALSSVDAREAETTSEPQQSNVPQTATIPIPVASEYANLVITVEWANYNPQATLELFNPGKTVYYDPSTQNEYGAKFVIPKGEVGTYELRVANAAACGAISTSHSGSQVASGEGVTDSEIEADVFVANDEATTQSESESGDGFQEEVN